MHYKKLNNVAGWAVFLIATIVYFLTLESTASLWDCGEYITAANKLEVGHPPGAPLFMLLGRLFSFFAEPTEVALWINRLSALSSSFTILFMYWSITMLGKKIMQKVSPEWSIGDQIAVIGAGVIGSLAYTFSDSFWFSAVEGEVYAMSSLFTAIIFWAILKWDSEMHELSFMSNDEQKNAKNPLRWIILLVLMLGLSIGVHLLGLLVIPAVIYIIYFRVVEKVRLLPFLLVGLLSLIILYLIQDVIIPNTVGNAATADVVFVNSLNLGFNMGAIFYFLLFFGSLLIPFTIKRKSSFPIMIVSLSVTLLLIVSFSWVNFFLIALNCGVCLFIYSSTKNYVLAGLSALFSIILGPLLFFGCFPSNHKFRNVNSFDSGQFVFKAIKMVNVLILAIMIGYSTFAVIVIRSNANTPLDENDPENLVTLNSYLKREQYGAWPILFGGYWNSLKDGEVYADGRAKLISNESWGDLSPFYLKRFVVIKNDAEIKAFKSEKVANQFANEQQKLNKAAIYTVKEKYFSSNEKIRHHYVAKYSDQGTFFPRMYYDNNGTEDAKIQAYKTWSEYDPAEPRGSGEIGADGNRLPSMGENLTYFGAYQVDWMYWRYFMWNFAGRQNDIQGHGDGLRGNYQTGIKFLDEDRIGSAEYQTAFTKDNPANNKFFLLPLVLGILGLIYHIYRDAKGAMVVFLLFMLTGMAIVVYLNQKPFEPRERDYAYAASFYAFAMWIGFGVLALYEAYKSFAREQWNGMLLTTGYLAAFVLLITFMGGSNIMITFLICLIFAVGFIFISLILKLAKVKPAIAAVVITLVTAYVPYLMGEQGWDDHNRHDKTSATDLAYNYLTSCAKNSILFTVGDNDTFPLWYLQEVEGQFTDIRVCNTSLFGTDWYTEQMKTKAYESEALPIKFREDQTLMYEGQTDQILFATTGDCMKGGMQPEKVKQFTRIKIELNKKLFVPKFEEVRGLTAAVVPTLKFSDPNVQASVQKSMASLNVSADSANANTVIALYDVFNELLDAYESNSVDLSASPGFSDYYSAMVSWEKDWAYLPIDVAMDFARDDNNLLTGEDFPQGVRATPCVGFKIPVDADNVVASGLIPAKDKNKCEQNITLVMQSRAAGKSDLMILDMLANNDWKRAMYFSSPGGTEVGMSLYKSGYLRQNGMAWEVSPIKTNGRAPFNVEAMYNNLMNEYHYGKMNQKGVLTDYYARRQTGTVRGMFSQLAEYYLMEAEMKEANKVRFQPEIIRLRAGGNTKVADSLANSLVGADEYIKDCKKRAISLIQKSLEVMPIDLVLDYGEDPVGRGAVQIGQQEIKIYQDGSLQDYVSILFRAGAKKEAEQLGMDVTDQLESTLRFFYNSNAKFAAEGYAEVSATISGLLAMNEVANDPTFGSPKSALAIRLKKLVTEAYDVELPQLYTRMVELEDGASMRNYLQLHLDVAADHFGFIVMPELHQQDQPKMDIPLVQDSDLTTQPKLDSQSAVMSGTTTQ